MNLKLSTISYQFVAYSEAFLICAQASDKWQTAEAESALGECLLALGRREEAKPLLEEGYNLLKERLGAEREWITERARGRLAKLR